MRGALRCAVLLLLALPALAARAEAETPAPGTASLPPLIPRQVLFAAPERSAVRLSPDGTRVAFRAPADGTPALWVRSLATGEERALARAEGGIQEYAWTADGAGLLWVAAPGPEPGPSLQLVDAGSGEVRVLAAWPGAYLRNLVVSPARPGEVLVEANRREPALFDVHRIDLASGEARLDTANPGDVVAWVADRALRVRAAVAVDPAAGSHHLRTRADRASPWRQIAVWPFEEEGGVVGFADAGRGLVVETSLGSDTTRLVLLDAATGEIRRELASHPRADVDRVLLDPRNGAVRAVSFTFLEPEWVVLDASVRADLAALRGAGLGEPYVTSTDAADTRWLVAFDPGDAAATYAVWRRAGGGPDGGDERGRDVPAASEPDSQAEAEPDKGEAKPDGADAAAEPPGRLEILFRNRPGLEGRTLARRQGHVLRARDGFALPTYVTLPPGPPARGLPAVVAVHGGPWSRDLPGWDPVAQWLANRGYAVLQVNFRGSAGFGKRFLDAGDGQWGRGGMQTDLADAAAWAVEQGIADPQRVGLYGTSYGGYAVLAGLAFAPGRYACGAELVGPVDLRALYESLPPHWAPLRARFLRRVGDVAGDEALNRRLSPLYHADAIRAPLLIGQGADDPRVPTAAVERLVEALRARDRTVEYVVYPGERHGLSRPDNRLDFFARTEAFLARHLGGRTQPPDNQHDATRGTQVKGRSKENK